MEENITNSPLKLVETDPRKQQQAKHMMRDPAFRHWFGQSMVHDQYGLPFMCYHGTGAVFSAFRAPTGQNGAQIGRGIYVATAPSEAEHYAAMTKTPIVMSLYVSAQQIVTDRWLWSALADGVFGDHLRSVMGVEYDPETNPDDDFDPDDHRHIIAQDRAIRELRSIYGFDGVSDGHQIMVFEPSQVKSTYA